MWSQKTLNIVDILWHDFASYLLLVNLISTCLHISHYTELYSLEYPKQPVICFYILIYLLVTPEHC